MHVQGVNVYLCLVPNFIKQCPKVMVENVERLEVFYKDGMMTKRIKIREEGWRSIFPCPILP